MSELIEDEMLVQANDGVTKLGVVDHLEGQYIKLTRKDSADGKHHYLPIDCVETVQNDTVRLNISAEEFQHKINDDAMTDTEFARQSA